MDYFISSSLILNVLQLFEVCNCECVCERERELEEYNHIID